jgi:hypothetical protein
MSIDKASAYDFYHERILISLIVTIVDGKDVGVVHLEIKKIPE